MQRKYQPGEEGFHEGCVVCVCVCGGGGGRGNGTGPKSSLGMKVYMRCSFDMPDAAVTVAAHPTMGLWGYGAVSTMRCIAWKAAVLRTMQAWLKHIKACVVTQAVPNQI